MLPGCLQWQLQKQVMAASLARGAPSARDYRYIGDSGKRQTSGGSTHWNMTAQLPPASSTSLSIPLAPRVLWTMQSNCGHGHAELYTLPVSSVHK